MSRLRQRRDRRQHFLRVSIFLLLVVLARRFDFPLRLHELEIEDRDVFVLHDVLRLQNLHGLNFDESARLQLLASPFRLFDAGREGAESSAFRFESFHDMPDGFVRRWEVEEDSIGDSVQFICESIGAHVPMLDRHVVSQSVVSELFSRLLDATLVEIEGVEMSRLL